MGWNASSQIPAANDADEGRAKSLQEYLADTKPTYELSDHAEEQIDIARQVALDIIESGVVGNIEKGFNVHIGGHSNPNHEGNDSINVNISQVT